MSSIVEQAFRNARGRKVSAPSAFGHVSEDHVRQAFEAGFGPDEIVWMFDLADRSALDRAFVAQLLRGKPEKNAD